MFIAFLLLYFFSYNYKLEKLNQLKNSQTKLSK